MSRRTVLIVDDDHELREVLAELLTFDGYEVATAANGLAALSLLDQGLVPAVILLDMMMPVLDGWRFLDELRARGKLGAIPVVVISASAQGTQVALEGVRAYLRKPTTAGAVLQLVGELTAAPG